MTERWSAVRIATSVALALWASAFWFLLASGRMPFYLSARTTWLAPVGGAILTIAALGRLASARTFVSEPLKPKHLRDLGLLVVPAIMLVALPPATLDSFAVSKRAVSVVQGYAPQRGVEVSEGDLSLLDVFSLSYNGQVSQLTDRAGSTVSFTGFVSKGEGDGADEFALNRFMITCCPGDAVNIQIKVVGAPPGRFEADDWVRVTGRIYPLGQEVLVDATEVAKTPRPKHPYLQP